MANRPVFVPDPTSPPFVRDEMVSFVWYSGTSLSQKRRSIESLHAAARMQGIEPLLEISSKATADIGRGLSAFNLKLTMKDGYQTSVENAYQASKVFRAGGPFCDLRFAKPREAKRDPRLNLSGDLIAFQYGDVTWPTHPTTAFYDWLYITALLENRELAFPLLHYRGFTDIEFNPIRSFSCQARSAALYVALFRREALEAAMPSRDAFIATIQASVSTGKPSQPPLL